ncbi:MAG: hypothetical protein ABIQ59_02360 [Nocardioidaceae bacterium]
MATELLIEIFEPDADDETVDELTRDLRSGLLELDVDSVSPVPAGPAPDGSKGLDMAAVGALLVQVKGSAQVVAAVVGLVRSWLQRGRSQTRTLKVTVEGRTLELSAATDEQQQRIVDEFVRSIAG